MELLIATTEMQTCKKNYITIFSCFFLHHMQDYLAFVVKFMIPFHSKIIIYHEVFCMS